MATKTVDVGELFADYRRMDFLDKLIKNCPHAEFDFNDDPDTGKPMGYSISIDGCEHSEVFGTTFREAVDAAMQDEKRRQTEAKKEETQP